MAPETVVLDLGVGLLLTEENISVRKLSAFFQLHTYHMILTVLAAHGCFGGTPLLEITKEGKIVKRGFL